MGSHGMNLERLTKWLGIAVGMIALAFAIVLTITYVRCALYCE